MSKLFFGCVPTAWKRAKVIALRKPEKATYSVAKSYRPISLLSILGKSLESIVNARIVRVLEKGGLFSPRTLRPRTLELQQIYVPTNEAQLLNMSII